MTARLLAGFRVFVFLTIALLLTGCASRQPARSTERKFDFYKDTFAFPNELTWNYGYDSNGVWSSSAKKPAPEYTLRCFVLARTALQFHRAAAFDASKPRKSEIDYRKMLSIVTGHDLRSTTEKQARVEIPGFGSLREFSRAHERMLKDECGGAWQSYVQRGHWRMVFPFSRKHQHSSALSLERQIAAGSPCVVHVLRFPELSINHALLLYDAQRLETGILFTAYDPNEPAAPVALFYDRPTRTFSLPRNHYFEGGPLQVYQVYHHWAY